MQFHNPAPDQQSFGTIVSVDARSLVAKLDNGSQVTASIFGQTPSVGDRGYFVFDKKRARWTCVSTESADTQSASSQFSFLNLRDTVSRHGSVGQYVTMVSPGLLGFSSPGQASIIGLLRSDGTISFDGSAGDIYMSTATHIDQPVRTTDTVSFMGLSIAGVDFLAHNSRHRLGGSDPMIYAQPTPPTLAAGVMWIDTDED